MGHAAIAHNVASTTTMLVDKPAAHTTAHASETVSPVTTKLRSVTATFRAIEPLSSETTTATSTSTLKQKIVPWVALDQENVDEDSEDLSPDSVQMVAFFIAIGGLLSVVWCCFCGGSRQRARRGNPSFQHMELSTAYGRGAYVPPSSIH